MFMMVDYVREMTVKKFCVSVWRIWVVRAFALFSLHFIQEF